MFFYEYVGEINIFQLARIFWANGLSPPLAENCPYAYDLESQQGNKTNIYAQMFVFSR